MNARYDRCCSSTWRRETALSAATTVTTAPTIMAFVLGAVKAPEFRMIVQIPAQATVQLIAGDGTPTDDTYESTTITTPATASSALTIPLRVLRINAAAINQTPRDRLIQLNAFMDAPPLF